ncbi:hypothetical protein [Burkholderia vietnamiensis]|uniref:hypothetical protein n=1 Tax=Burkholderia vietnamiensis TaxID=60552 RepID=UPI000A4EFAD0|nr:hypothetical protein [Burkholderia vietnamiensis]
MPSFLMHRIRFKNLAEFVSYAVGHPWTEAAGRMSQRRISQLRRRGGRRMMVPRKICERPLDRRRLAKWRIKH